MANDFSQPTEVTDADMAFGGNVRNLMPRYDDICNEYGRTSKWSNRLFADWFFSGIDSVGGLVVREGIDKAMALRHIKTVMGSFEPKQEHKEAACAFLFDKWFDGEKSIWNRRERKAG